MYSKVMNRLDIMSKFKEIGQLASVVKRLGNPESTILLHSSSSIFQIPQVDGVIGYHKIGNCVVVIGDPICLPQDVAELTNAFHLHCQEQSLKVVYFLIHHDFASWAIDNDYHTLIQVGEELSLNPTNFQKCQKLRWKVNQAIKLGVVINEYKNPDVLLEKQMKMTMDTWQKERNGPQMYLGEIDFSNTAADRIFYAQKEDRIVGLLLISPLDSIQGWTVNFYLALLDAPVGTTEHLMCTALDSLSNENCHFLCLGIVSARKFSEVIGLSSVAKFFANLILKMARWTFGLDARTVYLNKYHPHALPVFLLSPDKLSLFDLIAIKRLLNVKL
jgi:lysylphosphatidylglycerol synthetase-like protein (DUF2156 family)